MNRFITLGIVIISITMLTACTHPVDESNVKTMLSTETTAAVVLSTEVITETETNNELISITPLTSEYRLTDSKFPGFPFEISYLKNTVDAAEYIFLNVTCSSGKLVMWESGYEAQPLADVTLIRDKPLTIYWIPSQDEVNPCDLKFTVYYSNLAVPIQTIPAQLHLNADNNYTFTRP
ncbi:MAG: hypothetical protein LCH34_11305 [Firmicutes bacterium]|nr:hypothetical protein [Bacillota bacterium]